MILDNPLFMFASLILIVWFYSFLSEQFAGPNFEATKKWFFGDLEDAKFTHTFFKWAQDFPQQFSALFSTFTGSLVIFSPEFWKRPKTSISAIFIGLACWAVKMVFGLNRFGYSQEVRQAGRFGF